MSKKNKADLYLDVLALHKEVTGSCILCTIRFPNREKLKFIVDCGLFQEEKYQTLNYSFPFDPSEIDFMLVTHTHIDHIGRIPKLYKDGFKGKVYTSKLASQLMPIALNNTAEILSSSIQKNSRKKALVDSSIPIFDTSKPLFDVDDVSNVMENVIGVEYNKKIKVNDHVDITLFKNGHTLGSSCILVTIHYNGEEPIYALFTGDYSPSNVFFDMDSIPKEVLNLPINIITESTYGDTSKKSINHIFKDLVLNSVRNKETLIITLFAFGRMQEIKYMLKQLQDENLLDKKIKIYSDGKLAHEYDDFYKLHSDELKIKEFMPQNVIPVNGYEQRNSLLSNLDCKIILTTSGMGSYGPAQVYLPYYISKPKCSIIFGGYTAENTLGRKLQEVSDNEIFNLNGIMTKKKAKVSSTNEFSSHAKQEDLIEFMKKFSNIKSVLVNHGEEKVKEIFAKKVIEEINPKKVAILGPENYIRIGAYGVIKSYIATDISFNINS
ncbi:MAG: MBL fold metallo-hydrolase RNA specificity domain-containing protein [Clostridia bacterium]